MTQMEKESKMEITPSCDVIGGIIRVVSIGTY